MKAPKAKTYVKNALVLHALIWMTDKHKKHVT